MIRDGKVIISDMRECVKPMIASVLLEENFEGMGKTDKAEFETEFEMVLTLAEMAISQSSCEDAISRKGLMSLVESEARRWGELYDADQMLGDIEDFPSVTPIREHGEWIKKDKYGNDYCSKCGHELLMLQQPHFCPNCGADMRKEAE